MGERKVLNKYYPSDYDTSRLRRLRQPKNNQIKATNMLSMTIRCKTCGSFIYKGTKFNAGKEDVLEETYLGLKIFRFYIKCTTCSAEIIMKTDPRNSDYIIEAGATRNNEPWRSEAPCVQKELDVILSLENKALQSKKEIDNMAALSQLKSLKSRHAKINSEQMLQALHEGKEKTQASDEAALVKSSFSAKKSAKRVMISESDDDDDDEDEDSAEQITHKVNSPPYKRTKPTSTRFVIKKITAEEKSAALTSLCQNYEDA